MSMKEDVNSTTKATVAHNIAVLRDILGLSQTQFAERVQLPVERIRQMEGGPGALDSCVDLLRIAQSCNVQYVDLFETESESDGHSNYNANVPRYVMDVIDAKRIKEGLTKSELCTKVGAHVSLWAKWMRGICNPSPLSFNNIVAILGLKYYDFDAAKTEEVPVQVEEPDEIPKAEEPEPAEKEAQNQYEIKMLKVLRLQCHIDQYVADLDDIIKNIKNLRDELAKLK